MGLAFYRSMYTKIYYINTMGYFSSIENDIIHLNQKKMSEKQIKKVIELLSEIVEQGTDLSWQTVEKTEMLLKELNQNKKDE